MIRSSRLKCLFVSVAVLGAEAERSPAPQASEKPAHEAAMTVTLEKSGDEEYYLNVKISNKGPKPLIVYEDDLPWKGSHSMILVAVKADASGSILERTQLIDDPGPSRATIKSGEMIEGKILLNNRFPKFKESVKERDVIIFWSYQLNPIGAEPYERTGGWLLIHKGA